MTDTNEHDLDPRLRGALRDAHASPPFPKEEVKARIAEAAPAVRRRGYSSRLPGGSSLLRTALAAAAALAVFLGGAEYGRRAARGDRGIPAAVSGPIAIQTAGSEYVARLAAFTADAASVSSAERDEVRQVALATLYAATVELLRASDDDELLAIVARLIESRRQTQRDPGRTAALWF